MSTRIETQEIPVQTIETAIVRLPANEWQKMVWKKRLGIAAAVTLFVIVEIPLIFELVQQIVSNSVSVVWLLLSFTVCFLVAFETFWQSLQLELRLLKKYGWDGKSNYDVELEYQTFMHD